MRKPLIFTLIFILYGCSLYKGYYKIGLIEIQKPHDTKDKFSETTIINFQEDGKTKYAYEDSVLKISWLPLPKEFAFNLRNKSDNTIKIIWDDAAYVNENGISQKIIHSGIKYQDRNNYQPPSIIVKNSSIDDIIVPASNITYIGSWVTLPLFPYQATSAAELDSISNKYVGKIVHVLIPIQIKESINEYIFSFKIEGFIKEDPDEPNIETPYKRLR